MGFSLLLEEAARHTGQPRFVDAAASEGGIKLLDVAGPGHFAHRDVLGSRESVIDRATAGESTRELLADRGPYGLEFRDSDELDTDIWDRLYGGMGCISRVDRLQGELAERRGLLVLGILVERLARAWRHIGPAILRSDEFEIMFARRPGDEFLRRCDLLRACWYCKRPGPEPVGVLSKTSIRGQGE